MKDKQKNKNKIYYTILSVVAVICIAVIVGVLLFANNKNENKEEMELAYTELIKKIDNKEVEKIEMSVGSTSVKVKLKDVEKEKTTIVPSTQAFIELVQEQVKNGNEIEFVIIDNVMSERNRYLLVMESSLMDEEEADAIILKEIAINADDVTYELVEEDAEFERISALFANRDGEYDVKID